jgi:hypothetical protein
MVWPVAALVPGLRPALFRGVPFHVVDVTSDHGRRLAEQWFPGTDIVAYEDRGLFLGQINVAAFVIGDDYVARAAAVAAAVSAPGAGLYVDPWRGPMLVVCPQKALQITYSVTELRVAWLDLCFSPVPVTPPLAPPSLPNLLGAVARAGGVAAGLVGSALGVVAGAVAIVAGAVGAAARVAATVVAVIAAGRLAERLGPTIERAARHMTREAGMLGRATIADTGPLVVGLVDCFARDLAAEPAPAVAPRRAGAAPAAIPPRVATRAMLDVAAALAAAERATRADRAVLAAAEAAAAVRAVELATAIAYESREDAAAWESALTAALAGARTRAVDLLPEAADAAIGLVDALDAVRAALARDMHEIVGRLPAVRRVVPPAGSAHLLAHVLVGDDPAAVVPMVEDIARRNRLPHPGALPRAGVEVLR